MKEFLLLLALCLVVVGLFFFIINGGWSISPADVQVLETEEEVVFSHPLQRSRIFDPNIDYGLSSKMVHEKIGEWKEKNPGVGVKIKDNEEKKEGVGPLKKEKFFFVVLEKIKD